jgi:hypothetical protein
MPPDRFPRPTGAVAPLPLYDIAPTSFRQPARMARDPAGLLDVIDTLRKAPPRDGTIPSRRDETLTTTLLPDRSAAHPKAPFLTPKCYTAAHPASLTALGPPCVPVAHSY